MTLFIRVGAVVSSLLLLAGLCTIVLGQWGERSRPPVDDPARYGSAPASHPELVQLLGDERSGEKSAR
jgi:hypothetical protein